MTFPDIKPNSFDRQPIRPVNESNLGGTYKQTNPKGTRTTYEFTLGYELVKNDDAEIIETFLKDTRGQEFDFVSPLNNITYTVRLSGEFPKFSYASPLYQKISSFVLEEV